jgi:hypothetical protein
LDFNGKIIPFASSMFLHPILVFGLNLDLVFTVSLTLFLRHSWELAPSVQTGRLSFLAGIFCSPERRRWSLFRRLLSFLG